MSFPDYSDLDKAKYAVVHDFKPRGALSLAPLVRMNPGTLSNKVNPSIDTHHLTVDEAVSIQAISGDCRILRAEAAALGHVCWKLPEVIFGSDVELLNAYADWTREIGETAASIQKLLEGRITRDKLAEVHREMDEDFRAALMLFARFERLRDPDLSGELPQ